jgi:hypothetical protein
VNIIAVQTCASYELLKNVAMAYFRSENNCEAVEILAEIFQVFFTSRFLVFCKCFFEVPLMSSNPGCNSIALFDCLNSLNGQLNSVDQSLLRSVQNMIRLNSCLNNVILR